MNLTLRRSIAVAALALSPLASSCGFDQATDQVYTPGVGVNERSGAVDVLNALVVSGADGSGTLVATLNNSQDDADSLIQVSGAGEDSSAQVDLASPIELPPGGSVSLSDEAEISIEGDPIKAGSFVKLNFSFERAESITVEVPVVARRGTYSDVPVPSVAPTSASPSEEATAH